MTRKRVPLGNFVTEYSARNKNNEDIPVYSVTNSQGFCREYFGKEVASKDKTTYKIVPYGYFAYNPSRINVWSVDWQRCETQVIVSPLYNVFSVSNELDSQFLYYFLKSNIGRQMIRAKAAGSVRDNLKLDMLKEITIPESSLNDQRHCAATLDNLQYLIELRKKQLNELDNLIKARFVEMFGDPISNPMKWDICQLDECLERIDNGKSFICSDKPRTGDNPAILKLSAATYGDYRPNENKALLDESLFVESSEVHAGDLLFARKNTPELVGTAAYVQNTPPKLMMPDLIFRLVPNEKVNAVFLWQLINCKEFRPVIQAISGGSAKSMSNISKERLGKIKVICPPRELQDSLIPFVEQTDKSKVVEAIYKTNTLFNIMLSKGIDYNNLTEDEKAQLDEYLEEDPPTPDFNIPGNEIFKYLFNKDTCCRVLEELMQWGYRVDGGETLGKTIIFAYNHKHAQMIVDCFHELYPEYPPNTCQLVDYSVNYGDDLVLKFEEDDEFRIAVSVDMLDTGVDVPAVLNLVFFKKVRSKIKFVQMIGRGTRLCENIYGPGKNKSGFQIFDYCGNFEYFGEHPDGKDGKEMLTLSQRLFQIRLDMLFELQKLEYQESAWFHAYYDQIKAELHGMVVKIKSHSNRIQVREAMQYVDKYYNLDTWVSLSPVMVKEAKVHISPLLDSGLNGDHLSVAFDVRMYHIEKALMSGTGVKSVSEHVKNIRLIAQYLLTEKASVPQVLKKASELKVVMGEDFWTVATVQDLEKHRSSLRDLMQFLVGSGKKKFDINISDEVDEAEYQPEDTMIDIRTYREKVIDYLAEHLESAVIRKIHNLEPITNADLSELERILWHELGTKAEYEEATDIGNLAAFVRSLIGLSQEAVNVKFSDYLSGNLLNSQQQEFVRTIINYVRENGDVELADMVNSEPFNNYDLNEVFGINLPAMIAVVRTLHDVVQAA